MQTLIFEANKGIHQEELALSHRLHVKLESSSSTTLFGMDANRREKCRSCGIRLFMLPKGKSLDQYYCASCKSSTGYNVSQIQQLVQAAGYYAWSSNSNARADNSSRTNECSSQVAPWMPPLAYRRRKAVLCGVSYRSLPYELEGTINDVSYMRFFLVKRVGFPSDSILILTENERDPSLIPTKQNIQAAMRWLVKDCQTGDSLVFYFSGHGTQQKSYMDDEKDGYDETICPLDYEFRGTITDNEINDTIVKPLPNGATLHVIIDACHTGTILDLPFLCKFNFYGNCYWEDHSNLSNFSKGTNGGLAICFSACDDYQSSADTSAFSGGSGIMSGAMTYCFLQAADQAYGLLTYGGLLNAMRSSIREALGNRFLRGPLSSFYRKVAPKGFHQEPQLSSSEKFDVNKRKFTL